MIAKSVKGEEFIKSALISSDEIHAEWKTYRNYITKQPKEDLQKQLTELISNEMLITMFLNLSTLSGIYLSIPVGTASVERSFSEMKMIKTRLRNWLGECSLSYLMKLSIESPEKRSDDDLDAIIRIWSRKPRKIVVENF